MKLRQVLFIVLFAFAITLAVVVGWRMSAEAMAVVIGVIAGVSASIPTSLIVIWLTLRARPAAPPPPPARREPESDQPRIIVVNAPSPATSNYPMATPSLHSLNERPARRFTIIGGSEEEDLH